MVTDPIQEALRRAADPEDVVAVLERLLESSDAHPWVGRFVIAHDGKTARLTARLPRAVLELDEDTDSWARLDAASAADWEREVEVHVTHVGVDGTPAERAAARFEEFSRYDAEGRALACWLYGTTKTTHRQAQPRRRLGCRGAGCGAGQTLRSRFDRFPVRGTASGSSSRGTAGNRLRRKPPNPPD